ncbi:ketoacyl-ACP synthase III [bacterium]|nr:ketoacyl-ACP synthase III [bacterium]
MTGAHIQKIETYLPERILTNIELEKTYVDWSAEKIEQKTGVRERHIAAENETAVDLACYAANKLLKLVDPAAIDFLILCTQSPDYYLPPGSCLLQERLGLSTSIGALDFDLGCSGFIYGLAMAKGLIQAEIAKHVLFITSETYSKHIHSQDRGNRSIFGDGAAAILITASESKCIGEFALGTDGSGYQNLIVPAGGMRHRYHPDAEALKDPSGSIRTENHLYMNGPDIFTFTIEAVPKVVQQCLEKNCMAIDDLDYVIFHQANQYILNHLRKKVGIPENKFYMNMLHVGNTVSATIPIALKDSMDHGLIHPGDRVMVVGFGVGYSWGATVLRI